jgi:hypothetical protein
MDVRIVSHYADDVEFQSPVAVDLFGEALRTINGEKGPDALFRTRARGGPREDRVRVPGCLSRSGHSDGARSVKDEHAPSSWN